ncbi:TPA: hypothetical protein U2T46_000889 [Burkholderia cenocepacia]|nr:hypothetical protein [Burkholderia cenocepacia]
MDKNRDDTADERAALLRDALFYLKGNLPDSPSDHKRKAQVIAGLEGLARASSPNAAGAEGAAWFAVAMNAAASLEDAANWLTDPDSKRIIEGAAAFARKRANELWQTRTPRTDVAGGVPDELPHWFDMFLTNVCEIPDRNSPEGEPDAIVATLDELRDCAVNAIEQCVSYAPTSADAAAEDKYVIERLSTVLAGVASALLGEEADRPAAETLQKLPEEAAKLRLELDLYRAQAADADAAAAPAKGESQ